LARFIDSVNKNGTFWCRFLDFLSNFFCLLDYLFLIWYVFTSKMGENPPFCPQICLKPAQAGFLHFYEKS